MLSICKTSLKKYVLEADENVRMYFLHKGLGKPVKHSVKHQCLTNV